MLFVYGIGIVGFAMGIFALCAALKALINGEFGRMTMAGLALVGFTYLTFSFGGSLYQQVQNTTAPDKTVSSETHPQEQRTGRS